MTDPVPPDPIATHRFDSALLPAAEQFDAWARFTVNSRVTRPGPATAPFFAEAAFWNLNGMVVSRQALDPMTMTRDAEYLRASVADHFLIVIPIEGDSRFTAEDLDQTVAPGDVLVVDLNRLGACATGPQTSVGISLSRPFLEERAGLVGAHGVLPPTPETRLFASFMQTLTEQLPAASSASVEPLSRIVRDLLANAINVAAPGGASPSGVSARVRAKAYIERQPPGALDAQAMQQALGMTRSSLYRLFKGDGGLLAYDRRRRLRLLHRAIADPLDHRSFGELGYAMGFPDPAHLARLFRQAFGYSMSELRDELGRTAGAPAPSDRLSTDLYRQLIDDLD